MMWVCVVAVWLACGCVESVYAEELFNLEGKLPRRFPGAGFLSDFVPEGSVSGGFLSPYMKRRLGSEPVTPRFLFMQNSDPYYSSGQNVVRMSEDDAGNPERLLSHEEIYNVVARSLQLRGPIFGGGSSGPMFGGGSSGPIFGGGVDLGGKDKDIPHSNGLDCMDNPMVEDFDTKCSLIAKSLGGRLGCEKKLIDIVPSGSLPPSIPSFTAVADACPESCGLCETCAPNCALWFINNTLCDKDCNVPECQFDGGDCWKADCVLSEWAEWSDCSVTCGGSARPGLQKRSRTVQAYPKNGGRECESTTETRECVKDLCPLDCLVSDWEEWSTCSAGCDLGSAVRMRSVVKEPDVDGAKCPDISQERRCFFDSCAADCSMGEWGLWSECTTSCGGGVSTRSRAYLVQEISEGESCGDNVEERSCNSFACGSSCAVSEWTVWSKCSANCGGGMRTRERTVLGAASETCPDLDESEPCNKHECAQDCEVSEWDMWGICSTTCGVGTKSRARVITRQSTGAGLECPPLVMASACFAASCASDCILSEWDNWSACSASCGFGQETRSRIPLLFPSDGGEGCEKMKETRSCQNVCAQTCKLGSWGDWSSCAETCQQNEESGTSMRSRPILLQSPDCPPTEQLTQTQSCAALGFQCDRACAVAQWSNWSECTATCAGGRRWREREVETPQGGEGDPCPPLREDQSCGMADCPLEGTSVDCALSEWAAWSICDAKCGGGSQYRAREILSFPFGNGANCANTEMTQFGCNPQPCQQDCMVTAWSIWTTCSATCGGGSKQRARTVFIDKSENGKACPTTTETSSCSTYPCPVDCVVSEWTELPNCSVSCGEGVIARTRRIEIPPSVDPPGSSCGPMSDTIPCVGVQGACASDCELSEPTLWSDCSVQCGGGLRQRTRQIVQRSVGAGRVCDEDLMQEMDSCNMLPCVQECLTSEWSDFSECSVSCGKDGPLASGSGGVRTRTRAILRTPGSGAPPCPETLDTEEGCNKNVVCAKDCVYSRWSAWGSCDADCGIGQSTRVRTVMEYGQWGGTVCDELEEKLSCVGSRLCIESCQVSEWSEWGECGVTCGGGYRKRSREITVIPINGGNGCAPLDEYGECNNNSCAGLDCVVSVWSPWGTCSKPNCGGGVHERSRSIITPATGGGLECPPPEELSQLKGCNVNICPGSCSDNEDVASLAGVGCAVLAAQGCTTSMKALAEQNNRPFPKTIPPETRISDACPATCDVCQECAPGCQLREVGNRNCEEACNVEACQMDMGDCGGDCELPILPKNASVDPPVEAMITGQTVVLACAAPKRFDGLPALRKIAVTCQGEGVFTINPDLPLVDQDLGLQIPSCQDDVCPYVRVEWFPENYEQFNGVYVRGDAVDGYGRYVQVRETLRGGENLHHLWLTGMSDTEFVWRLTPFAPEAAEPPKLTMAVSAGPDCILPPIGRNADLNCGGSIWQIAQLQADSAEDEVRDVSVSCLTASEAKLLIDEFKASAPPSDEVQTFVYGQWMSCADSPEVEETSGQKCDSLATLCDYVASTLSQDLPDYLPHDTKIRDICPQTCGGCETCAPDCPVWFLGNGYCDETCNVLGCNFDNGDCGDSGGIATTTTSTTTSRPPPSDSCKDDGMVEDMGFSCDIFKSLAQNDCTRLLSSLDPDTELPSSIPASARVQDACPYTCDTCAPPACADLPEVEESTGYSCAQIKDFVAGNCEVLLSEIANNSDDEYPPDTKLRDVCPATCDTCGKNNPTCKNNPIVEDFGYSCDQLKTFGGCDALLADLSTEPLPPEIPPNTRVEDACLLTCDKCPDIEETICRDDPVILQMGYSCALFLQFGEEGCRTKIRDLIGYTQTLPNGISDSALISELCKSTCDQCQGKDGICEDNDEVVKMGYSCSLLIQGSSRGCEGQLDEMSSEPLPDTIPPGTRVKDVCPKSCDTCYNRAPSSCDDGRLNGEEEGIDCGGSLCRPCQSCSAVELKSLGVAYEIVSTDVSLVHGAAREIQCRESYEQIAGPSEGIESLLCNDGHFEEKKLFCAPKKLQVLHSTLEIDNIADMGYVLVKALQEALTKTLQIRVPQDELRVISVGNESILSEAGGDQCIDDPRIETMGYACSMMAAVCSMKLGTITDSQGITLPDGISRDMLVSEACPLTCGVCTPTRRRLLTTDLPPSLIADFVILSSANLEVYEKRFDEDTSQRFLAELELAFVNNDLSVGDTSPSDILKERNISNVIIAKPVIQRYPSSLIEGGFKSWDSNEKAQKVFAFNPLFRPDLQEIGHSLAAPNQVELTNNLSPLLVSQYEKLKQSYEEVLADPVVARQIGQCVGSVRNENSCCELEGEFDYFLKSSCGALLYAQEISPSRVRDFCTLPMDGEDLTSTCFNTAVALTNRFEKRGGEACVLVQYVQTMIRSWCSQGPEGYCFANLNESFASLKITDLATKKSSELDGICAENSCFRYHLSYFNSLTQLRLGWKLSGSTAARRLDGDKSKNEKIWMDKGGRYLAKWEIHNRMGNSLLADLHSEIPQTVKNMWKFWEDKSGKTSFSPRKLQTIDKLQHPIGGSTEDLLDFVCTQVEGDYCQETLLLLVEEDPIRNPSLIMQPCSSRCFVPISGRLGDLLEDYGYKLGDPYNRALGSIMRGYGRFYCNANGNGTFCGDFLFEQLKKTEVPHHFPKPLTGANLDNCRCPKSYIQDNECDPECFNAACGYDGEDCLVQRMFPEVFIVLTGSLDPECLFYNTNFVCSQKCRSQFVTSQTVVGQGCCMAAGLEMTGAILKIEEDHPNWGGLRGNEGLSSARWNAERTIPYLETNCEASFDRTCSAGQSREIVIFDITFKNVDTEQFIFDTTLGENLRRAFRSTTAQYLKIFDTDIVKTVIRKDGYGVAMEMKIDPGSEIALKVKKRLLNNTQRKRITNALKREMGRFNVYIHQKSKFALIELEIRTDTIISNFHTASPVSWDIPPPPPTRGMWGVDELGSTLTLEDCPPEQFSRLNLAYILTDPTPNPSYAHGASRTARCGEGFEALVGSSPDVVFCNNGRWEFESYLDCRASCVSEPNYGASNGYVVEGTGLAHGSARLLQCLDSHVSLDRSLETHIYCHDGLWTLSTLICKQNCGEYEVVGEGYVVQGAGFGHGAVRLVSCDSAYHLNPAKVVDASQAEEVVSCLDGSWTSLTIECLYGTTTPNEDGKTGVALVIDQILSSTGKTITVIGLIFIVLLAIGIVLAWRFYFRGKAKKHLTEREAKVDALTKASPLPLQGDTEPPYIYNTGDTQEGFQPNYPHTNPQFYHSQDFPPHNYGPQDLGPENLGSQNYGPPNYEPHDLGPQNLGPQNLGPQNLGPQNLGPQILESQANFDPHNKDIMDSLNNTNPENWETRNMGYDASYEMERERRPEWQRENYLNQRPPSDLLADFSPADLERDLAREEYSDNFRDDQGFAASPPYDPQRYNYPIDSHDIFASDSPPRNRPPFTPPFNAYEDHMEYTPVDRDQR